MGRFCNRAKRKVDRRWLADKRAEFEITQTDLSMQVGISQSTLSLIEAGYVNPSARIAARIAEVLKFDPSLFEEKEGA